jgi:hypothetical protein
MMLEEVQVGQVWHAGGDNRLIVSIHTPYMVDPTEAKKLTATTVHFNDGSEAKASTVLKHYQAIGWIACPSCGQARDWRQYGTAGGVECDCGHRMTKNLGGPGREVRVVSPCHSAVCIRCGEPHNGDGEVCDACDKGGYVKAEVEPKAHAPVGQVAGATLPREPGLDVQYKHKREGGDPLSMSTSDSPMARTYCATFSADAQDLSPRFHEPGCSCGFCASRLPHGQKPSPREDGHNGCSCRTCAEGRRDRRDAARARGELDDCDCVWCKGKVKHKPECSEPGFMCRCGTVPAEPDPQHATTCVDCGEPHSRSGSGGRCRSCELGPPPPLTGAFKSEDECTHPWHDAIPNGRALRCPWCLADEPGVDRSLTAVPRPGQIWCDKLHGDREHTIVDEDLSRGPGGFYQLKAHGYPSVWLSANTLRDGDSWFFLRGPTDAETEDERKERLIRKYLDRRPEGIGELAWRRIVHGTVEHCGEVHSTPFALQAVEHALSLYAGVATINENEDR